MNVALQRDGLASAQCRAGYVLVTGYVTGTAKDSWFDPIRTPCGTRGPGGCKEKRA